MPHEENYMVLTVLLDLLQGTRKSLGPWVIYYLLFNNSPWQVVIQFMYCIVNFSMSRLPSNVSMDAPSGSPCLMGIAW